MHMASKLFTFTYACMHVHSVAHACCQHAEQHATGQRAATQQSCLLLPLVQWSEDKITADPFVSRSRARVRMPAWVSNTIARDRFA